MRIERVKLTCWMGSRRSAGALGCLVIPQWEACSLLVLLLGRAGSVCRELSGSTERCSGQRELPRSEMASRRRVKGSAHLRLDLTQPTGSMSGSWRKPWLPTPASAQPPGVHPGRPASPKLPAWRLFPSQLLNQRAPPTDRVGRSQLSSAFMPHLIPSTSL